MARNGRRCAPNWPLLFVIASTFLAQSSFCHDDSYTWRFGASLAVMGDFLYIQGGTAILPKDGFRNGAKENRTFAIPLTQSWSKNDIDLDSLGYANDGYDEIASDSMAIWTWPNKKQLMFWGGTSSDPGGNGASKDARVRTYTPNGSGGNRGRWGTGPSKPTAASSQERIYRTAGGSWTQCNGLGFYLGGAVSNITDSGFPSGNGAWTSLSGLLIYDLAAGTWRNRSTENFGDGKMAGKNTFGSAACLPTLGTNGKGIVVFVGGSFANLFYTQEEQKKDMLPMNKIIFYDIGSDQFYTQHTTGDTPRPRHAGCIVAAKAGDSRTYEIVAYGGCTGPGDTYILTIPGFRWFSVDSASRSPMNGRQFHSCTVIGQGARQMLAYGGYPTDKTFDFNVLKNTSNPWGDTSLQILDMTELKWKESYDHNAPNYQQPSMVRNWYKDSGLKNVSWDQNNRALFANIIDNPLSDEPLPIDPKSPPLGAIIGGAVGGFVGLVLVAGSIFYFCRYRRRRQVSGFPHNPVQEIFRDETNNRQSQGITSLYQPPPHQSNVDGSRPGLVHDGSSTWYAELQSPSSSPPPHKNNERSTAPQSEGFHTFPHELPTSYQEPRIA